MQSQESKQDIEDLQSQIDKIQQDILNTPEPKEENIKQKLIDYFPLLRVDKLYAGLPIYTSTRIINDFNKPRQGEIWITDISGARRINIFISGTVYSVPIVSTVYQAYGNMYLYTLGSGSGITITVSASNTFYQVSSGITGGLTNGFTFQNSRELKCLIPGTYYVNWSMSIESSNNNQEVEGGIMIGGIANTMMSAHTEIINSSKPATISGSGIIVMALNDLISLSVLNHTAANNVTVDHLTFSITQIII